MRPQVLFCHYPFGKDLTRLRAYREAHRYDGVEWNLATWRLMMPAAPRRRLFEAWRAASPLCSVHAPYTDLEIGYRDPDYAAAACRILKDYIDAAADLGAHHINLHVGTYRPDPSELDGTVIRRSVTDLLEYGARRRVPITLENLAGGPTSVPEEFAAILRDTGAPVTFDLGHAAGCKWVLEGHGTVLDFLNAIPSPILASHVYQIERKDTHFAPKSVEAFGPVLAGLIEKRCSFWVLELHSLESLEQTRRVVDQYLDSAERQAPST